MLERVDSEFGLSHVQPLASSLMAAAEADPLPMRANRIDRPTAFAEYAHTPLGREKD